MCKTDDKWKFFNPPGWYAGIAVTKNGSWSMEVVQSESRNYKKINANSQIPVIKCKL